MGGSPNPISMYLEKTKKICWENFDKWPRMAVFQKKKEILLKNLSFFYLFYKTTPAGLLEGSAAPSGIPVINTTTYIAIAAATTAAKTNLDGINDILGI